MEGKNGYAKTRIVDFPRRNSHISGGKVYFSHFLPIGKSAMEKSVIFRGSGWEGGGSEEERIYGKKLLSDTCN